MCGNDHMALGVLDVFGRAGVGVPGDVIVTGFDGIEAGRYSIPRLTTVHQPMAELGRTAIGIIINRLQNPDQPPITARLLMRVFLRESSEGAAADWTTL
jgi:LacI family transcriptional regulator